MGNFKPSGKVRGTGMDKKNLEDLLKLYQDQLPIEHAYKYDNRGWEHLPDSYFRNI